MIGWFHLMQWSVLFVELDSSQEAIGLISQELLVLNNWLLKGYEPKS